MADVCDGRSAKTREALLEAGLLCFSERGFHATSIRTVAERAGKNMSLIAHHFGNKEGLYLAVFRDMLAKRSLARFKGPVISAEELAGNPRRAEDILRELIRRLFEEMHRTYEDEDPKQLAYFKLWLSAIRVPIPELEPVMRQHVAPLRTQMAACIQAIRPDLSYAEIPFWCSLVFGQCLGNTLLRGFNQLAFGPECYAQPVEKLAQTIADITLQALGRPTPLQQEHP